MVVLLSTIGSLLLASSAVALPHAETPVKRGIKAPAHHCPAKYNTTVPNAPKEVGAVQHIWNGGGWILPVLVGGQQVFLNVDTGSSDLWTASTLMPEDQQKTVTRGSVYNPNDSSTAVQVDGYTYGLSYADGSGSSGPVYRDTVNIGGAIVPNFALGVTDDLRYGDGSDGTRDTAGPVGLGFGQLNSIRPNPQPTFMEALVPYVPEPIFSTAFKLNDTGFINFGYVDHEAYTGTITEVPVANTSSGNEGQWMSLGISFGSGGDLFDADPLDMDFDSGTPSLSVSEDIAAAYFGLVDGSDNSSGSWQYPCGTDLPDLDFVFSDVSSGPSTVTIPGLALKNGDGDKGDMCSTWMGVVDGRGNAGVPFYISKYIVWNQAKPSMSFADQVN
ncbi:aspartic peptidase domain-containing protein [Aspergillus stella-maris]|uniref:aspartic peptidase domain-containing protein n=1 Tax=Aspergillus stella-maris TaxID=1810926 RepID=UPI003CCCDAA3